VIGLVNALRRLIGIGGRGGEGVDLGAALGKLLVANTRHGTNIDILSMFLC
jgi:hypothetical protein